CPECPEFHPLPFHDPFHADGQQWSRCVTPARSDAGHPVGASSSAAVSCSLHSGDRAPPALPRAGLVFRSAPPAWASAAVVTPGRWLRTESEHHPARDTDIRRITPIAGDWFLCGRSVRSHADCPVLCCW